MIAKQQFLDESEINSFIHLIYFRIPMSHREKYSHEQNIEMIREVFFEYYNNNEYNTNTIIKRMNELLKINETYPLQTINQRLYYEFIVINEIIKILKGNSQIFDESILFKYLNIDTIEKSAIELKQIFFNISANNSKESEIHYHIEQIKKLMQLRLIKANNRIDMINIENQLELAKKLSTEIFYTKIYDIIN